MEETQESFHQSPEQDEDDGNDITCYISCHNLYQVSTD